MADGAKKIASPEQGVEMDVTAYFAVRKSWSRKKQLERAGQFHTQKPDQDNVGKLVQDALNGGPYPDDSCVALAHTVKLWTAGPSRTEVVIRSLRRGLETGGGKT